MTLSRLLDARRGPDRLVLIRHGESVGNLADAEARERGADRLDLDARDADVELSETGRNQADAVGRWLAKVDDDDRPTVVLSSPYRRAAETARRAVADVDLEVVLDERLRERDLGVFDGMTGHGIRSEYPKEAERRKKLGKFYYQPPSGESWCDVVLRVRQLMSDVREGFDGANVWLFTHQAVIMSFRYVLEGLSEQELLELDGSVTLGNASVTRYERGGSGYELEAFADTSAVDASDEKVTHEESRAGDGDAAS
ncbi:MAG TPA: histidine phosphatase family protein [Marmoricola sp.]|nr:histidine phosphatase family protein [Marmoricola sp.]